jgi:hypothetical protein
MKSASLFFVYLGICGIFALSFAGCAPRQPGQATSTRPDCVTLPMYSSVIEQVMAIQPTWDRMAQIKDGSQYQWTIQNERAKHTLSATLTSAGCVCAATATSHFHAGQGEDEMAGLLQGAAVAPVSDLNYTARWLEPKISLSCTFAFIFHRSYQAETLMADGTTWKLTCSRSPGEPSEEERTILTVIAPGCIDLAH